MKQKKYSNEVFMNLALITQLGISMLVPVFLLLAVGLYLEKQTGCFLAVPCLVLGMLAGFRNVYILAMKANRPSKYQKKILEENELVNEAVKKRDQDQ